jgi:hypothetical protein
VATGFACKFRSNSQRRGDNPSLVASSLGFATRPTAVRRAPYCSGCMMKEASSTTSGFTSTIMDVERASLTRKLEGLRRPPGFTGKAPAAPLGH